MFGTFPLFAAFYVVLIISTLITCCIFKDTASRVAIGFLAVLTGIYVAGPAVEFMQGYIRACQMIADYIVVYCGPAGSVLVVIAIPVLMFFIPAPPCKEEDQCCEDGCKSEANPSGYCDDCYVHPDRICKTCDQWGDSCFEAGKCVTEGLWRIATISPGGEVEGGYLAFLLGHEAEEAAEEYLKDQTVDHEERFDYPTASAELCENLDLEEYENFEILGQDIAFVDGIFNHDPEWVWEVNFVNNVTGLSVADSLYFYAATFTKEEVTDIAKSKWMSIRSKDPKNANKFSCFIKKMRKIQVPAGCEVE